MLQRHVTQVRLITLMLGVALYTPAEGRSMARYDNNGYPGRHHTETGYHDQNYNGNYIPVYPDRRYINTGQQDQGYRKQQEEQHQGGERTGTYWNDRSLQVLKDMHKKLNSGDNNMLNNITGNLGNMMRNLQNSGVSFEEFINHKRNQKGRHWNNTMDQWGKNIDKIMTNATNAAEKTKTLKSISDTANKMKDIGDQMKDWYKKGHHDMSKYGEHEMHHFDYMKHMLKALVCKVNEISSIIVAMQAKQDFVMMRLKQMVGSGMHAEHLMGIVKKIKTMNHKELENSIKELDYMHNLQAKETRDHENWEYNFVLKLLKEHSDSDTDETDDESDTEEDTDEDSETEWSDMDETGTPSDDDDESETEELVITDEEKPTDSTVTPEDERTADPDKSDETSMNYCDDDEGEPNTPPGPKIQNYENNNEENTKSNTNSNNPSWMRKAPWMR